ncbi:MAG: ATP-binding protein [Thermogutta sp.]
MVTNAAITLVFSRPRDPHADPPFRHMVEQILQAVTHLPVVIVPHLYDVTPGGPVFAHLQRLRTDMILLAPLYPRAAQLVLRANGLRFRLVRQTIDQMDGAEADGVRRLWAFDYREYGSFEVLQKTIAALAANFSPATATGQGGIPIAEEVEEDVRPRWYPVIDDEACINCLECLNFCLFGVYDVNQDGRVFAAQPDQCRTGCPACARVCPAGAIVFPLYPDAKIAGADSAEESGDSRLIMLGDVMGKISTGGQSAGSSPSELERPDDAPTSGTAKDLRGNEDAMGHARLTEVADTPEKSTLQQWLREAEAEDS